MTNKKRLQQKNIVSDPHQRFVKSFNVSVPQWGAKRDGHEAVWGEREVHIKGALKSTGS